MLGFPRRSLPTRSPLSTFEDLFQGVDEMFSRLHPLAEASSSFNIDATEEGGNVVIRADLPGIRKEDIEVTLENGTLTISAKRESTNEHQDDKTYVKERTFGSFCRSLRVPADVCEDVHATLNDGVLQLILKRAPEAKRKQIEIKG